MSHPSVVTAVEARLKAGFVRQECPIFTENEIVEAPGTRGAWILIDFPWSRGEWVTADEFEEEGAFRITLAIEARRKTHEARGWLEEIAVLFRGQAFGGVQCYAPQSPASGDQNDAGGYFRLMLTVPYRTTIEG